MPIALIARAAAGVPGSVRPGTWAGAMAMRKTRVELANAIFEYIESFHNNRRRHSSLNMLTPMEFEELHQKESS